MSIKRVALADLGWCVGRMSIDDKGVAQELIIFSPAETSPDRYAPAESVYILGRENILALKRFLDENLNAIEHGGPSLDTTECADPPLATQTADF
jgi:hypothetical protein